MILKVNKNILDVDLNPFTRFITDGSRFFPGNGDNHHQLLSFLSHQLPKGSKVADLGTLVGHSAVALASNPDVQVISIDLEDYITEPRLSFKSLPNVRFIQGNCLSLIDEYIDSKLMLVDVAPHDGVQEAQLFDALSKRNYKGVAVLDDIESFDGMKRFWNTIGLKKFNVTRYGHWSGTGIVVFDPSFIDVEVD